MTEIFHSARKTLINSIRCRVFVSDWLCRMSRTQWSRYTAKPFQLDFLKRLEQHRVCRSSEEYWELTAADSFGMYFQKPTRLILGLKWVESLAANAQSKMFADVRCVPRTASCSAQCYFRNVPRLCENSQLQNKPHTRASWKLFP